MVRYTWYVFESMSIIQAQIFLFFMNVDEIFDWNNAYNK